MRFEDEIKSCSKYLELDNKTVIFPNSKEPINKDFIDLYDVLRRNVEILERVEKLLEDNR